MFLTGINSNSQSKNNKENITRTSTYGFMPTHSPSYGFMPPKTINKNEDLDNKIMVLESKIKKESNNEFKSQLRLELKKLRNKKYKQKYYEKQTEEQKKVRLEKKREGMNTQG